MSDNIPLEIQVEILKRLPVKSLLQFRSVCKTWKSLIGNPNFNAHYSSQMQHLIAPYNDPPDYTRKYVSFADNDTVPRNRVTLPIPLLVNMLKSCSVIGSSRGVLCLFGYDVGHSPPTPMAVLWNISVRKAVAVVVPNIGSMGLCNTVLGFGVCRETSDPKILKIIRFGGWQIEVFTLSTGVWRRLNNNLPRKSIHVGHWYFKVDIDGVLYGLATDWTGGVSNELIMSFDMTSEEFTEVNLPDVLAHHRRNVILFLSKLRESLVILESGVDEDYKVAHVWMMDDGVTKSFTKLFVVDLYDPKGSVLGFRKSGELIIETIVEYGEEDYGKSLVVYDPYSKHVTDLGINGLSYLSSVYPYMETLLLLDHPDFIIYDKGKRYTLKSQDESRDEERELLKHTTKGKLFGFRFKWLKPKCWTAKS